MTKLLSIASRPGAPIACDMRSAPDTLAQRLAEYRRLFEHALTSRESTATGTTFRFTARPGVREWVCDLAYREAACCPFLSYEIDQEGDEIVWTTAGGLGVAEMDVFHELLDGPESLAASSDVIAQRLQDQGQHVVVPSIARRPDLATRPTAEGGKEEHHRDDSLRAGKASGGIARRRREASP